MHTLDFNSSVRTSLLRPDQLVSESFPAVVWILVIIRQVQHSGDLDSKWSVRREDRVFLPGQPSTFSRSENASQYLSSSETPGNISRLGDWEADGTF